MTFPQILLLFVASMLGGTLNSVAGGGSFFTFPALVFTGVPLIPSNATSTVALWPGAVASIGAYRRELVGQRKGLLFFLVGISLIGGLFGALLLLKTSPEIFQKLLPYLLLIATLLFAFSKQITSLLRVRSIDKDHTITLRTLIGVSIAQLIISIYGGYFGGGIGILMLATLALMGMENIHSMNALKMLLTSCINGIAVITFIVFQTVVWPQAIVMIIGAIVGGYGGAYFARKIDPRWIRLFVIIVGFALTIFFFVRQ